MKDLLYHAAPAAARDLSERLSGLLSKLPADDAATLRPLLRVEEHERPRMVLTGQYSSGKSTLIKALTDEAAEVVIDSAVATDRVEIFDWDGLVDLVDTPGVEAGVDSHDELAEDALRTADLVLFTVTVDLFDDRLVAHLHHVLEDLRKGPQLLVAVTKCRSLAAGEGVREAAVREALGGFADLVRGVECDAKTYVDGLHESDPSRAARRLEASNMVKVRDAINTIARERGDLARFRVPLQQVALVAAEALALLAPDKDEEAILTVLARQRRALTSRRTLLDSALNRQAVEFRSACIRAAEQFVDTIESIEQATDADGRRLEAELEILNDDLGTALRRFNDGVNSVVDSQLSELTSEVSEIEASPFAHRIAALDGPQAVAPEAMEIETGFIRESKQRQTRIPVWAPKAAEHIRRLQSAWGAGSGVKAAAGSPGHKLVYEIGKQAGVKFKPYQAVRLANNIGKVAKVGSIVLPVALETYSVLREHREEMAVVKETLRRRNALVGTVLSQCDEITSEILRPLRGDLDVEFDDELRKIDDVRQSVRDNQLLRSELDREITAVQLEAERMLDRLGSDTAE